MLIVAGIAFYNGFTDITLALTHPGTRYLLIPGYVYVRYILFPLYSGIFLIIQKIP